MKQDTYWYCFNPKCTDFNSRVFIKNPEAHSHLFCGKWVASEEALAKFSSHKFTFDQNTEMQFFTSPIKTQAFLHHQKQHILQLLESFSLKLRSEAIKKIDSFRETIKHMFYEELYFQNFGELQALTSKSDLNETQKSLKLSQLLTKPLPTVGNVMLPNDSTVTTIISSLHSSLQRIFLTRTKEVGHIQPTISKSINNASNQMSNSKHFLKNEGINEDKKAGNQGNGTKFATYQQNEIFKDLWQYITQNCNLNTAAKLMKQPLQKFYSRDIQSRQSKITCGYCLFEVSLKTKTKPQTNSACSYAIMEHLYKQHPFNTLHNYYIAKQSYFPITLNELLDSAMNEGIKSVTLIDGGGFCSATKITLSQQKLYAIELVYGPCKPLHLCEYLRGQNSKEILVLVGMLIARVVLQLKKELILYTNQQRAQIVEGFCNYYKIDGVKVIIPQKKVKLDVKQRKLSDAQINIQESKVQ